MWAITSSILFPPYAFDDKFQNSQSEITSNLFERHKIGNSWLRVSQSSDTRGPEHWWWQLKCFNLQPVEGGKEGREGGKINGHQAANYSWMN